MPRNGIPGGVDARPSPIAGEWYSGDPEELARNIDGFLGTPAPVTRPGELIGLVSPHAGHIYSGAVAGRAFALARGLQPELVAVVSPVHTLVPAPVVTSGHQVYRTPLGDVPVDSEAVRRMDEALKKNVGFGLTPIRDDQEHSLEIELPFLQRVLGGFRLLPVMILDPQPRTVKAVGLALAEVLADRKALLVASSDLSHRMPADVAAVFDREMLRRIEAFDPEAVLRAEDEGVGYACGRAAVAAVLWAARALGGSFVEILAYANSGDVNGNYNAVVGYGAAAVWRAAA
jgi:MEMO1 family protein